MSRPALVVVIAAAGVIAMLAVVAAVTRSRGGPPEVTGLSLVPLELRYSGGEARVEARVASRDESLAVNAHLWGPDGAEIAVAKAEKASDLWQAVLAVPPNLRTDGQALAYRVVVEAVDGRGRAGQAEATLRVTAAELPPPLPSSS